MFVLWELLLLVKVALRFSLVDNGAPYVMICGTKQIQPSSAINSDFLDQRKHISLHSKYLNRNNTTRVDIYNIINRHGCMWITSELERNTRGALLECEGHLTKIFSLYYVIDSNYENAHFYGSDKLFLWNP